MAGMPVRAAKKAAAESTALSGVPELDTHPAWYFILYLLLQLDDPDLTSVNASLALHGMPPCTASCLARAFATVNPIPAEFLPTSRTQPETRAYLQKLRIYSLFHPEESTEEMRDAVLGNSRLRSRIETLLLGRVSTLQISRKLSQSGMKVSVEAVEAFRHYFWNTDELTITEWATFLGADTKWRPLGAAMTTALFCGPEVAMHRAGLSRTIDTQDVLERMAAELDSTFREIQALPLSPAKVEMLTSTVRTMLRVDERRQESDSALQDVLHRFERFRMKTDGAKLPTLGTLAPAGSIGDFSRDEIRIARREDS